jgi:hypothetical protein
VVKLSKDLNRNSNNIENLVHEIDKRESLFCSRINTEVNEELAMELDSVFGSHKRESKLISFRLSETPKLK